jgi:hypothetical protein
MFAVAGTIGSMRRYCANIVFSQIRERMDYYTLLLFDTDDGVVAVRPISAHADSVAAGIARHVQIAHAPCGGYLLWRGGQCIAQTHPTLMQAMSHLSSTTINTH